MPKAMTLFTVSALIPLLLIGCMFSKLKKDIQLMETTVGIGGTIINRSPTPQPLTVVLYSEADGTRQVRNVKILSTGEKLYFFLVPIGDYRIVAFEDANRNLVYDDGEYFGYYGKPDLFRLTELKGVDTLDIEVARTSGFPDGFTTDLSAMPVGQGFLKIAIGTVVTLDDPRFSQENAGKGFWQPFTALQEIGAGVYFLEPFDPKKIPVLFVHGAAGTPRHFRAMAEHIDRSRYQPWFFHYPSGFPLYKISRTLNKIIAHLRDQYPFDTLYVTAHSMGGLVARSFILENVYDGGNGYVKLFVTISSPFGGLETAQKGVESAPTAIPSWYDVVPGSPFIQKIFSRNLRDKLDYYLLFGYKGDCSLFMDNNDGSVTIRSQLDYRAQADAVQKWGFDEGHVAILSSPAMLKYYNGLLDKTTERNQSKLRIFGVAK